MSNDLFRELDQVFSDILAGTSQAGRVRTARAVGQHCERASNSASKHSKTPKVRRILPAAAGCCALSRALCLSGRVRSAA